MKYNYFKGVFGAILLWFCILGVLIFFSILNTNIGKENAFQTYKMNSSKLLEPTNHEKHKVDEIYSINAEIKRIIADAAKKLDLTGFASGNYTTMADKGYPTHAYEEIRRQLELDIKEMWYSIRSQASNISQVNFEQIQDIYRVLRSHLLKLRREDGYEVYREQETKDLSKIIQKRIHDLQNPPDCASARKLVCSIHNGCGFGCQTHHVVNCMVMAYASSRTLILESKGWRYNKRGWDQVFLPVSDSCNSFNGSKKVSWGLKNQDDQVLSMSVVRTPRPLYLPIAIPADIAVRLEKMHGEPHIWWIGQFLTYLLRLQPQTQASLNKAKSKMNFSTPCVGVHVRRTDKRSEAKFYPLKQYMEQVDEYFSIREKLEDSANRNVFIASDDPRIIDEANKMYQKNKWHIMADKSVALTASVAKRYSDGLFGIIKDVFLLTECDYVVCTFSSNICRLAYEMMQAKSPDASGRFVSLDAVYYFADLSGGSKITQTAQFAHRRKSKEWLDLRVGDQIEVAVSYWNGTSKGTNRRTNMTGLYPSYKGRNLNRKVNFPIKKWWTESGEV